MRANILVIDDEAGPRESLRMILKPSHNVRTADGGLSGIREVEREVPDIVFLDLNMPDMHGTEVLKAIKDKHPEVEVAIITAYAAVESARIAVKCGAIDYLTKPYSVADVEGIVAKAVKGLQKQHDAELLTAQLSRVTETLIKRSQDDDAHPPVADALTTLHTVQTSLNEDLESVRDLSDLGEVAAEVSHDINNLLTVILTSSQFLLRQLDQSAETDPQNVVNRVSTIVDAAQDCSSMIRRIKDFTRSNTDIEATPVNLSALVASAVEFKRETPPAHGGAVEYRLRLSPVPDIWGDEVALRNVIVNLIENSIDALNEEGFIELSTWTAGDDACIRVRDNGFGMSATTVANATTAFFSTKKSHGTGLGLSIVDKIVKKHHGTLKLASEEGVGTTITLQFPITAPTQETQAAPEIPAAATTAPSANGRGTIIVAEDEDAMRSLLSLILESEGYTVKSAPNGAEAWELLVNTYAETQSGSLMLVTDHEMPGMLGREVAAKTKELDSNIPVLIVSGYISGDHGPEDQIITKPFDIDHFLASIETLLQHPS